MLKNRKPIDLLNLARLIENLPTKLLKSCTRDRTVQYNAWVISDDLLGRPAFYAIFVTPRVDQQLVIGLPAHRFAECGPLLLIGAIVFLLFFFSRRTCFFFYKDPKKLQGYTARFQSTWLGIQLKIEPFPSNLLWPCSSQDLVDVLIVILSVNSSCGDFAFKLKPCMQKMLQYYSAGGSLSPEILHVE